MRPASAVRPTTAIRCWNTFASSTRFRSVKRRIGWKAIRGWGRLSTTSDPTMLLDPREWKEVAVPPKREEKYILTYFMQKNEGAYAIVRQIKRETGCRVYDISRYGYQPDCVDECLVDVGPEEFVGLFASAQHVCTNSFHGLVFSLIFNKTVDYIPIQRFGGRIEYLCELLHIGKTPVRGGACYHMEYDPAQKDAILEVERQKARAYLKKGIELAHDSDH